MNYEEIIERPLEEGANDKHIFKAVIMIGGPGSGKSFVVNKIKAGSGLKTVDSDIIFEYFTKKHNHDIKTFATTPEGDAMHHHAWELSNRQMQQYLDGRLGLILDSTGKNFERIVKTSKRLEDLGYDIIAIFVNTNIDTASRRNQERNRTVRHDYLINTHAAVRDNLGKFQNYFKNLLIIDNSDDSKTDFDKLWKDVNKFINQPVHNPIAVQWLKNQKPKSVTEAKEKYPIKPLVDHNQHEQFVKYAKNIVSFLKKNCAPWLKATNNGDVVVYRGVRTDGSENQLAYLRDTRTDRKPMDTEKSTTALMNKVIADNGKVANRNNSLCVSGNYRQANEYGKVFILMPVGKFNYTWDKNYQDWTNDFDEYQDEEEDEDDFDPINHLSNREALNKLASLPLKPNEVAIIAKILGSVFSIKKFNQNATLLKTPSEINVKKVLKTIKHVYINLPAAAHLTLINIIRSKMPKKVKKIPEIKKSKTLFGDDGTLIKAIKSKNEIMIASGSSVYISEPFWDYYVKKLLKGKVPTKNDYENYEDHIRNEDDYY